MKANFLWILPLAALLAASCDNKKEGVPAAESKPKPVKPLASKHRPESPGKTARSESLALPTPGEDRTGLAMQSEPQTAPGAQAQLAPSPAPAPGQKAPLTTEEANAWRESRKAEQRAERVTRMTEQMTARFKERDANGDGVLAQSEVSERMQRGFGRADANGDGSLDAAEQEAMIQSMAERGEDGGDRRGGDARGRGPRRGR